MKKTKKKNSLFNFKPVKLTQSFVAKPKKPKLKSVSFGIKPIKLKQVSFIAKPKKIKTSNLIFGYDHPKKPRKVKGKLAMSWPQAKKKYPKMSPFGDADKDGVKNWLDCRPFDKKRQAWKPKSYKDSEVIRIPIKKAFHLRGEYSKQRRKWSLNDSEAYRRSKALREKADKKGEYLDYDKAKRLAYKQMAEEEAKKLKGKGHHINKIRLSMTKNLATENERERLLGAYVDYSTPNKLYKKEIKSTMKPQHTSDMGGGYETESEEQYVKNISKSIKSDKPEIEMILIRAENLKHGLGKFGEGRHRILAAMKAKQKTIPIEIVDSKEDEIQRLKIEEARDKIRIEKGKEEKPEALKHLDVPDDEDLVPDKYQEPIEEEAQELIDEVGEE